MKLIPLMIRGIRLATAAALVAGPAGPICAAAGTASAPKPALRQAGAKAPAARSRSAEQLKLPQYFEVNRGQTDPSVKFFTRAGGYNLYLTANEAVMVAPAGPSAKPGVVRMKLKGANPSPAVQGLEALPGYTNYLIGADSSQWRTGVKQYGKVKFTGVYPGIDMVYRFDKGNVEYDFIVAPGAKPWRILLGFEGAKGLRLDAKGNLVLRTETGEVTYKAPDLYQTLGSKRVPVKGRFVLASNNHVRFEVGNYVQSKELVIDPALSYSSFLGGTVEDRGYAVVVDATGNAYVTGSAISAAPFPGAAGHYQAANGGAMDAFITKVNPTGTAIVWSTYYGGAGDDVGLGIGIDATLKVYITGNTTGAVPAAVALTDGALGGTDGFVAAFAADGNSLIYSRQFGGPQVDSGNGIAVDAAGNAYVTGVTGSIASGSFPTTPLSAQPDAVAGAQTDAFVMKLNSVGAQVYGSYLGGTGADKGNAIAIDTAGNAYIAGQAGDAFVAVIAYPTVFKNTVTGASDAFIVKMDPTGANFVYKTYVGGSGIDEATGIAVDSVNDIYITGYTFSADFPDGNVAFPTIGQTTIGTAPDAFVFKLKPFQPGGGHNDGVYATYLGASGDDRANAIVVDSAFFAYVTGTTYASDFPMVDPIAEASTLVGAPEAFVTQVGPTGGVLGFSTYLGGTTMTGGQGIALDSSKNIFVTGWTNSTAPTFPIVAGSFQVANAGTFDAFITKFGSAVPPPSVCAITNVNPASGFTLGGTTVTITGTDFAYSGPGGVTFDSINAQSYTVNAASTVITAVTPRHPLTGALVAGPVTLRVTTSTGSCTAAYTYVLSPIVNGACVDEYFFPSPVTGSVGNFAYCMAQAGTARIMVYNAIGDLVAKIEDSRGSGAQLSQLNTGRLASGVYLYRLEKDYGGGNSVTSKVKKFVVRH